MKRLNFLETTGIIALTIPVTAILSLATLLVTGVKNLREEKNKRESDELLANPRDTKPQSEEWYLTMKSAPSSHLSHQPAPLGGYFSHELWKETVLQDNGVNKQKAGQAPIDVLSELVAVFPATVKALVSKPAAEKVEPLVDDQPWINGEAVIVEAEKDALISSRKTVNTLVEHLRHFRTLLDPDYAAYRLEKKTEASYFIPQSNYAGLLFKRTPLSLEDAKLDNQKLTTDSINETLKRNLKKNSNDLGRALERDIDRKADIRLKAVLTDLDKNHKPQKLAPSSTIDADSLNRLKAVRKRMDTRLDVSKNIREQENED